MSDFRQLFSQFIQQKGISQGEVAERMGTTQQAVSQLLMSDKNVRPSTKGKIYRAFPEFRDIYEGKSDFVPKGADGLNNYHPM